MDKSLLQWATARQREILELRLEGLSNAQIGERIGITKRNVEAAMQRLRKHAAKAGYAPDSDMTHTVPDGYHVKGVSTLYNAAGEVSAQWVKSQTNRDDQLERAMEAIERVLGDLPQLAPTEPPDKVTMEDLLCVYPIGDPHIGMYAWAQEAGEDFNTEIATAHLRAAIDELVDAAPPARTAILAPLGDTFHSDSRKNATTAGTPVDVDGRQMRVIDLGFDCLVHCARRLLQKHDRLKIVVVPGNHDTYTSLLLGKALDYAFAQDCRVDVDRSPSGFQYHRFGANLLGFTHGHGPKPSDLGPIMATDRASDWGETKFRRWYTGHVHHESVKEYHGCLVETFRTLAAKDAWHSQKGYRSDRDMKCDVIHRRWGLRQRHVVNIEQLRGK